jgi:hypothetical protein
VIGIAAKKASKFVLNGLGLTLNGNMARCYPAIKRSILGRLSVNEVFRFFVASEQMVDQFVAGGHGSSL